MAKSEIVLALYQSHPGSEEALRALIRKHVPILRIEGLATNRQTLVVRSSDGTYLEVFEWISGETAEQAHRNPKVQALWGEMEKIAKFRALSQLPEAAKPFSHFELVAELCQ